MFKKIVFSVVVLIASISSLNAAETKIGVFNERLVLSKIPQMDLIDAKLKKQFSDQQNELQALQAKGLEMQKSGERDAMTMTEAQKIKLQRDLADISAEYNSKAKNLKEDAQRANQEEIKKIRIKVQQTVVKIAEAEGFDLILRFESTAYNKNALDISNKIITILSNPAG